MSKILCIYAGYTVPFNGANYKNKRVYGSEINIIQIAEWLSKKYNYEVYIWIWDLKLHNMETIYNKVHYLDMRDINNFSKPIDILLINRYINFFLYSSIRAKKTYIYVQDIYFNYYYKGGDLPNYGNNLIHNICRGNLVDGIICISNFQKQNIYKVLGKLESPIYLINNGITSSIPERNEGVIIKNRFIYCSNPSRGLDSFLDCIIELQKKVPDCSVVIFRSSEFTESMINKLELIHDKIIYDKVIHDKIIEEFIRSDIWFYPCSFKESYCNCAAEAQLFNTVCVYNNIAALETTIGNRGLALNPNEKNYKEYCVNKLVKLLNDNTLKSKLREKGYQWAKKEIFEYKIDEWYELFESK